jgi:hypothetical protein
VLNYQTVALIWLYNRHTLGTKTPRLIVAQG